MIYNLAIIGGGPAGMMAAISASEPGNKVCLLERNGELGKKLLITGKGRCNFTSSKNIQEIAGVFGNKGKFFLGCLNRFSNTDLMDFFKSRGVDYVIERGDRVFPKSSKADTILNCLLKELKKKQVTIIYNFRVESIKADNNLFQIKSFNNEAILAAKVVLATGGKSYPETGSTGDGYKLASVFGHNIIPPKPALVALISPDINIRNLAGLSLKNVKISFYAGNILIIGLFGEMLFTHNGITGPIVLSGSKKVGEQIDLGKKITASIDFKPALSNRILEQRINREMKEIGKKEYQSLLVNLLPKKIIPLFILKTEIDKHKRVGSLLKEEKQKLIDLLKKDFTFNIKSTAPPETAIVTSGGVDINDINSVTLESKKVRGLYFSGEIIGLDAPTGGFNLQKAFSTGWVAGKAAIRQL